MRTLIVVALGLIIAGCSSSGGGNAQSTSASSPSETQPPSTPVASAARLVDSNLTFNAAQAACKGALGSVTFAMGHARAHAAAGVDLKETQGATSGVTTMVFTDKTGGKTSTVEVNGHDRSVSGANVAVKQHKSVACVMPQ